MSLVQRWVFACVASHRALRRCASLSMLGLLACAHADLGPRGEAPASTLRSRASADRPSTSLEARVAELQALTLEARARGAYRCAPEELARSEAHLEFARRELDQGDRSRAREHLVLVSANAKAALRLSAGEACTAASPSAAEARHPVGFRGELTNDTAQPTKRRGSTEEHAAI